MIFAATSGLPYVRHNVYFNLCIAPLRGAIERHVALVTQLQQLASVPGVTVHGNLDSAEYKFATVLLARNGVKLHLNAAIVYCLPGAAHPVDTHAEFVLLPGSSKSETEFDLHPTTNAAEPVYRLQVMQHLHAFHRQFALQLKGQTLQYNNLVNLCIMVKNGGALFEQVLRDNIKWADRWTILDTGSTDETLETIHKVLVGKHPGTLHQEPFINFRDSRNRCLDLAGVHCKYNVMLDDTYVVRGDIRSFLETIRGDEFGSSYSLYVQSDDTEYTSNRITRSELGLRYKFKMHEVITDVDNVNVMIPREVAYIDDLRAPYMEQRTLARKAYDLQVLLDSIQEEPDEPRHLYYTAQTYSVLNDAENAAKYFQLRAEHEGGFLQERVDACFELARTKQFKLGHPWCQVQPWYLKTLELEPRRVDALYFLGVYHVYDGRQEEDEAFKWFEQAFTLGYPVDTQYSLKPTLVFYFLPHFLAPLCYTRNQNTLGLQACERLLTNLNHSAVAAVVQTHVVQTIASWRDIYASLCKLPPTVQPVRHIDVLFVVDGNWSAWSGADIEHKGLGGSETWAVEMASAWQEAHPDKTVVLLCKCVTHTVYRGVEYVPIQHYEALLASHTIGTCIVSRFSHYVFAPLHTTCERVLLYLHDLGPTGNVLPTHDKLQAVYCLSPWHQQLFAANFPSHALRATTLGYGIDTALWAPSAKRQHSFIYSSFPDRGLYHLLRMWPRIQRMWPDATLDVFCNLHHNHVRRVNGPMMEDIDKLLATPECCRGVTVRGWVSKRELRDVFACTEYWLYPCIFDETFCMTALEAVACQVIGIAPPKAALQHLPLQFVPGDASTTQWHDDALHLLQRIDCDAAQKGVIMREGRAFAMNTPWMKQAEQLFIVAS